MATQNPQPGGFTMTDLPEGANAGGSTTSDLLESVIEADGGLERWEELDSSHSPDRRNT
jgi:hypothetical protein